MVRRRSAPGSLESSPGRKVRPRAQAGRWLENVGQDQTASAWKKPRQQAAPFGKHEPVFSGARPATGSGEIPASRRPVPRSIEAGMIASELAAPDLSRSTQI